MSFQYRRLTDDQRETLRLVQTNGRKQYRIVDIDQLLDIGLIVRRQDRLVLTSRGYGELRILRAA